MPPTRASLILLLEPVFAAMAAYTDGERMTLAEVLGALLILAAALMAELPALRAPRAAVAGAS